MRYLTIIGTAY